MNDFSLDISELVVNEPVHSYSNEELEALRTDYVRIKKAVTEDANYDLTLEEQRAVIRWMRADREVKFMLKKAATKVKKAKSKVIKEVDENGNVVAKVVKIKKPKKLSNKAMGLLALKEARGEALTDEEIRNRDYTLTGEYNE